jgi:hypothetical protein
MLPVVHHRSTIEHAFQLIKTTTWHPFATLALISRLIISRAKRERERESSGTSTGNPTEFEAAPPLVSLLASERRSPEGECATVQPSHDSALNHTLPKVSRVDHDGGSGDGGTLRSSPGSPQVSVARIPSRSMPCSMTADPARWHPKVGSRHGAGKQRRPLEAPSQSPMAGATDAAMR